MLPFIAWAETGLALAGSWTAGVGWGPLPRRGQSVRNAALAAGWALEPDSLGLVLGLGALPTRLYLPEPCRPHLRSEGEIIDLSKLLKRIRERFSLIQSFRNSSWRAVGVERLVIVNYCYVIIVVWGSSFQGAGVIREGCLEEVRAEKRIGL